MRWLLTMPTFGALGLILAVELRADAHPGDASGEALDDAVAGEPPLLVQDTRQVPVDVRPPVLDRGEQPRAATALIRPASGSEVVGLVRFWETGDGQVAYDVELHNLEPGLRAMHVHQVGDCSADDASSAGDHFSPRDMPHGGPTDVRRHVGDLGNVLADDQGVVRSRGVDRAITLRGDHSVLDRALVVHAGRDDYTSQPAGDAGTRIGCGVIRRLPPPGATEPREEG